MPETPHRRRRGIFIVTTVLTALVLSGMGVTASNALSGTELVASAPAEKATSFIAPANYVEYEEDRPKVNPVPMNPSECGVHLPSQKYSYSMRYKNTDVWKTVPCKDFYYKSRAGRNPGTYAQYDYKRELVSSGGLLEEGNAATAQPDPVSSPNTEQSMPSYTPRFIDFVLEEEADELAAGTEESTGDSSETATDLELQELVDTTLDACDDADCLPGSSLDEAMSDGAVSDDPGDWEQGMELTGEDDITDEFIFKRTHAKHDLLVRGCFDSIPKDFDGAWGYSTVTHTCITTFDDEDAELMSTGSSAAVTSPAMVTSLGSVITNATKAVTQGASGGIAGTVTVMLGEEVIQTTEVAANGAFAIALPDEGSGVHTYTMVYEHEDDPEVYDYVNVTVLAAAHNDELHTAEATDAASSAAQGSAAANNNPTLLITLGALFGVAVIAVIVILARRRV